MKTACIKASKHIEIIDKFLHIATVPIYFCTKVLYQFSMMPTRRINQFKTCALWKKKKIFNAISNVKKKKNYQFSKQKLRDRSIEFRSFSKRHIIFNKQSESLLSPFSFIHCGGSSIIDCERGMEYNIFHFYPERTNIIVYIIPPPLI